MLKRDVNVYELFEQDREEEFRYENVEGGLRIVGYLGSKNFVEIPESINGQPVVEIGEYTKGRFTSIYPTILLPNSISRFDPDAFHHETRDLWIGNIFVKEDNPNFAVKDGVLYSKDMSVVWFCFNKHIEKYEMPNSVEIVKKGAFRAVENTYILDDIRWSERLRVIEDFAFSAIRSNHRKAVTLPASLKSIGCMAFGSTTQVVFQGEIETVTGCPAGSFSINSSNYVMENNYLYSSDKKKAVGFSNLNRATSYDGSNSSEKALSFLDSTEEILPYAFSTLASLAKLELGSSIKKIGSNAFLRAPIKTIRIPAQVEEIADDAFGYYKCSSIIVDKANKHFLSDKICLYRINEDGSKTLMRCFKDSIEEYAVLDGTRDILGNAFYDRRSLKTLILPNSLEKFDALCLRSTSVKSIIIPAGVKDLKNMSVVKYSIDAANPCLNIEGGVLYKKKDNGDLIAIDAINGVKSIEIKEGTVAIDNYAFSGYKSITEVKLPTSLLKIGHDAFSKCSIEEIDFNEDLKYIDDCAFEKTLLVSAKLPCGLEYVARTAFNGCPLDNISINNSVDSSEDGVLYSADKKILIKYPEKKSADAFDVPETVEHIGQALLGNSIKKIVLPNNLKCLGANSLDGEARNIAIGEHIVHIDEKCFGAPSYSNKKKYKISGHSNSVLPAFVDFMKQNHQDLLSFDLTLAGMEFLATLSEKFELLPSDDGVVITGLKTDDDTIVIPAKIDKYPVKAVSEVAFDGKNVSNLTIESSETAISFKILKRATNLVLPEGWKEIPEEAFKYSDLASIKLPSSIEKIGIGAFNGCNKLESIVLPGSLKTLEKNLFGHCDRLRSVIIEEGVENISAGVFFFCKSLEKVVLPESIVSIDNDLFSEGGYKDLALQEKTIYYTIPGSYADLYLREYTAQGYNDFKLKVMSSLDPEIEEITETFNSFVCEPNGEGNIKVLLKSRVDNEEPNVVIPEKIGERMVTALSFTSDGYIRSSIESITIPKTVVSIDAFKENAFYSWSTPAFKEIIVDEANPTYFSDGKALYSKDGKQLIHIFAYDLTEFEVPSGVVEICSAAFAYQKNLVKVILSKTVETIGDFAFSYCENLNEIVGADSVANISASAFERTPYLKTIPLAIYGDVLKLCNIFDKTHIEIPEGIREIADSAFSNTRYIIETIKLPSTLKVIGKYGLPSSLREITIPEGVESIPESLFYGMESLKSIELPASLKTIGVHAFPDCGYGTYAFEKINVSPKNEIYCSVDGILYSKDVTTLIKVPGVYPNSKIVVPETVTCIDQDAFAHNKNIVEVTLPESVKQINNSAFKGCENLKKINLERVKTIGEQAFEGCEALDDVTLSCEAIPQSAFGGCYKLKKVTLHNTVEICDSAFYACAIQSIEFPSSLHTIGESAFKSCRFEHITIPKTVKKAGRSSFGGAKNITVYDTLDAEVGCLGISHFSYKNYIIYHMITVVSAETDEVKFSVPMDSDGSADYCRLLTGSWGKNATFNFHAIDMAFAKLKAADVKMRTAVHRLKYPIDLLDGAKEVYAAYVAKNAKAIMTSFIDNNDLESFVSFEAYGTIKKANISELMEYASKKKAVAFTAYLMEYQNNNFGGKKEPKNELSLGSVKTVSPWQVARNAITMVGRYKGTETEITFPSEIKGTVITGIASATTTVPENYKSLVSVIIPEGYKSIGDNAFLGCENLEKVVLPSSIEKIGVKAFANCKKLKEIVIPDGVTEIGKRCFEACKCLEIVKLPISLERLEEETFSGCSKLISIDLPRNLRSIYAKCFANSGLKNVVIHNRKPWFSEESFPKGTVFTAYEGVLKQRGVKIITLADLSSNTMISVSLKTASGDIVNVGLFLENSSATITRFTKKDLTAMYASVVDKESFVKFLSDIYGAESVSNSKISDDISAVENGTSVKLTWLKEEKQNCDGKTIAEITFTSKSNIQVNREGTFAPRKQMDKYYNYYFVEDKEEY